MINWNRALCRPIHSVIIILVINKSDSRFAVVRFCYHLYDYRLNWTPLSPVTIINRALVSSRYAGRETYIYNVEVRLNFIYMCEIANKVRKYSLKSLKQLKVVTDYLAKNVLNT